MNFGRKFYIVLKNLTVCSSWNIYHIFVAVKKWVCGYKITFLGVLCVNCSDPDSGLEYNDFCLGYTRRDCNELSWTRLDFNPNISYITQLTDGIPIWLKVKAVNRGMLGLMHWNLQIVCWMIKKCVTLLTSG